MVNLVHKISEFLRPSSPVEALIHERMHRECYRFLKIGEFPEAGGALVLAAIFVYFMDQFTAPLLWFAALTVAVIFRGAALRLPNGDDAGTNPRKVMRVSLTNALCGTVWGLSILLVVPMDDMVLEAFTFLWIVSVSVSAVATMAMSSWITLMHVVPVVICAVTRLAMDGNYLSVLIAVGLAILYGFLISVAVVARRTMASEIRLQLENAELVEVIEKERSRVEELNGELQDEIERRIILEDQLRRDRDMAAELSTIDALTGVGNRREFDQSIVREAARAKRNSQPLSLILVDVDYFKAYNDEYGHQMGDDALRAVASVLEECTRRSGDSAARYGGEEFAVVLPDTQSGHAIRIAETIRAEINNLHIPHERSSIASHLTVSLGVATIIGGESTAHDLIGAADRALYEAKGRGRDRVISAPEPTSVSA